MSVEYEVSILLYVLYVVVQISVGSNKDLTKKDFSEKFSVGSSLFGIINIV